MLDEFRKCKKICCLWYLHSFNFSSYDKYSMQQWERVKIERENCPKNCEKYIEIQKIIVEVD